MSVPDDKGPMQGPRTTDEVMKSAAAIAPDVEPDEAGKDPPAATATDSATTPVQTDQEDA